MKKIVILGPESTGKSTLARQLADHYGTIWVTEYAREYLDALDRPYEAFDLLEIAKGQIALEEEGVLHANDIVICDTNLWVIKVWSDYKYGTTHKWIEDQIKLRRYDYYMLTDIDVPWKSDPQREHPNERSELLQIYKQHLSNQPVPFAWLRGGEEIRFREAIERIDFLV